MNINILIQFRDNNGKPFLGRGPVGLLEEISRSGSINRAAKHLKMSYSKAHAMVKRLEAQMNMKLLEKTIGGSQGGGTLLTPEGKQLISEYHQMEEKLKALAMVELDHSSVLKCLQ